MKLMRMIRLHDEQFNIEIRIQPDPGRQTLIVIYKISPFFYYL